MGSWWGSWFHLLATQREALGSKLEELGDGFYIPVRVADVDMAKICGQLGHFPLHIEAGAIPVDKLAGGKSVA